MLTQSVAIARFLAKKFGYYPADDLLAYQCDKIIDDTYSDDKVFMKIMKPCFSPPEAMEEAIKGCFDEALPELIKRLEPYLKDDGFLLGDKPTMVDFFIGSFYVSVMKNPKCKFGVEDGKWKSWCEAEANKKFVAYGERFAVLMKDYLEKRFEASF